MGGTHLLVVDDAIGESNGCENLDDGRDQARHLLRREELVVVDVEQIDEETELLGHLVGADHDEGADERD